MLRYFGHRPLILLLLGMVIGINLHWFVLGFLAVVAFSLFYKERLITIIAFGLLIGSLVGTTFSRHELPNPSNFSGVVEVRSFGEFRQDATLVDAKVGDFRTVLRIPGQVALSPGDLVDVISQNQGSRKGSISAKEYTVLPGGVLHQLSVWRLDAMAKLQELYGDKNGAWIQSLTFNFPNNLTQEDKSNLILSGTYHLVSASGIHVVVIALFIQQVLFLFAIPRHHLLWIIFGLLLVYTCFTGFHPPTLRAAIMWQVGSCAYLFRRSQDGLSALSLAAVLWLIFDPDALFQAGFQLSYVVTGALLVWFERLPSQLPDWVKAVQGSCVAFLAAEPISAWWFGRIIFSGVVTNLLIELPSSAVMILGFLSLIPGLGPLFVMLGSPLVKYLQIATSWTSALPTLEVTRQSVPVVVMIAYYVCLLLILVPRTRKLAK